jgi:dolichol-phosphate mannosyltransferase
MLKSASPWRNRIRPTTASLARLGKFMLVGGVGTLVNTGVLVVLYQHLHVALVAASAIATELAIANNFLWNNYWTFSRRTLSLHRFARFNMVSLGGQCITIATLWVLVHHAGTYYVVANISGIGLALIWNFVANVSWTWRPER